MIGNNYSKNNFTLKYAPDYKKDETDEEKNNRTVVFSLQRTCLYNVKKYESHKYVHKGSTLIVANIYQCKAKH